MEIKKSYIVLVAALGAVFVLSSCGGNNPQAATRTPANTPVATPGVAQATKPPSGGEGAGEGGVEAALVTYTDAAQRFSIGHPGTWTQDPSVTSGVKFNGGDDSMTLEFATYPAGQAQDAVAYAKSNLATVTSAYPGFKQVGLDLSTEVAGAAVLGFEANGKSVVTGKPYTARGDRYYIPMSDGRLAILTVLGPNNHYDREGVRDIALTLKSTK